MESEASHLHQKRRKHTARTPLLSSSVHDSNFESGVLPGELITEILLRLQFVGSVNGLICVAIEEKDVFLWNPSIRNLKKLPSSGTDSFYTYGFGYDELHDDYTVVVIMRIVGDDNSGYNVGKIYSLNSISWKCLDDIQSAIQIYKSGGLVNGKLHWAITNKVSINYNDWVILVVDVWVMKEYGVKKSWTKMFNISDGVYYLFGPSFCMSSEGEFLFKNTSFFMIYNPHDDSKRFPRMSNYDHL
ncbi:hypothetical protein R3W88_025757 [Solanum pinnatisectum]|uniref:F-box associated beta-propeller type 1 domain-containing protein n=1 Tax=Solanum pinnatisectum TaxID=50273 RepID=A0AAV9M7B9_9SOLN|nr:hypothetical protein R3W88_025757 [Solanum pinnatisectum]